MPRSSLRPLSDPAAHIGDDSRCKRISRIRDKKIFFIKMREAIEELPESQQQFYRDLFVPPQKPYRAIADKLTGLGIRRPAARTSGRRAQ